MAWRLAESLKVLRAQVDAAYPGRDKSSDGTIGDARHAATKSEHNPDRNGVVRAMDITNDPGHGIVARKLAETLVASRDRRILYIISNAQIVSSYKVGSVAPWVWRPYGGENAHRQHMHISVVEIPVGDDRTPWNLKGLAPSQPPAAGPVTGVLPAPRRFTRIIATVFNSKEPGNKSLAYVDVKPGWDERPGCALPGRIFGKRPFVRVINQKNGQSVICELIDIGPWNVDDPYWATGMRPQAESGRDKGGRHTNKAGIDLTPAAARAIGLNGLGFVDWEFVNG